MADQDKLEFEGEEIYGYKLSTKGDVRMGSERKLKRHQKFGVVGELDVDSVSFAEVKEIPTRVHGSSLRQASLVDLELINDILGEQEERNTGQLRMLTDAGEARRAARLVTTERKRAVEVLGFGAEHLDEKQDGGSFIDYIENHQFHKMDEIEKSDTIEAEQYFELLEHEWIQVASVAFGAIEWTHRKRYELAAAKRAEQEMTVDGSGTAMTAAEVAEAQGIKVDKETGEVAKPERKTRKASRV